MRLVVLLSTLLVLSAGLGYWLVSESASEPRSLPKAVETDYPTFAAPGLDPDVDLSEVPALPPKDAPLDTSPKATVTPAERAQAQEPAGRSGPSGPAPSVSDAELASVPSLEQCPVRRLEPLPRGRRPLERFLSRGAQVLVGVEPEHGPYEMWRVEAFECAVGRRVDFVQYAQPFDEPFYQYLADRVWAHGAVPVLTWEPWSYRAGVAGHSGAVVEQPRYSLRQILAGRHDTYIRRFARGVRRFGRPLLLRFGPEMNGNWNSWSEGVNGNRPGDYVRAWRRVHRLFEEERARNVLFVWSPNTLCNACGPLGRYYPGDAYVDVVSTDGYNWGKLNPWNSWRWFDDVFAATFREFRRLAPTKPMLISETASAEKGGDKARWVADLLNDVDAYPRLAGFTWFNHVKETDWRVQSSERARAAFFLGLKDPPQNTAAAQLRKQLGAIEARYHKALAAGYLYP